MCLEGTERCAVGAVVSLRREEEIPGHAPPTPRDCDCEPHILPVGVELDPDPHHGWTLPVGCLESPASSLTPGLV